VLDGGEAPVEVEEQHQLLTANGQGCSRQLHQLLRWATVQQQQQVVVVVVALGSRLTCKSQGQCEEAVVVPSFPQQKLLSGEEGVGYCSLPRKLLRRGEEKVALLVLVAAI